jgi:hypothetical protein
VAPSSPTRWHQFQYRGSVQFTNLSPQNSNGYSSDKEMVLRHIFYLSLSQIQGLTLFMEEYNLEQRMQISSSEEEKELAALMKLQKKC